MATALTMLVALLSIKKSSARYILVHLKVTLTTLATTIAGSFIMAASGPDGDDYILATSLAFFTFVVGTLLFLFSFSSYHYRNGVVRQRPNVDAVGVECLQVIPTRQPSI
jgi:hypothetical protein